MQLTHARLKHTVMSPLISLSEIHIQNNHLRDNKQPYSHAVKLPDGCSGGSEFLRITKFPEVYHGQGISKAAFSGGERPVTGQGRDTTSSVVVSWEHRYMLCHGAAARRRG
uniref:Uncharacterized protein n=1 Tax=Klebsiella pneumoniae TaxID=573 RepID=A0A455TKD7_KLEPN|nr:hypothetical protein [Klebsiella pneumoniae]